MVIIHSLSKEMAHQKKSRGRRYPPGRIGQSRFSRTRRGGPGRPRFGPWAVQTGGGRRQRPSACPGRFSAWRGRPENSRPAPGAKIRVAPPETFCKGLFNQIYKILTF